jgi:PAS domain S-box-containing protein
MSLDDRVKYRTLIETAPDAIFLVDMNSGEVLEVNEQALDLLGYDREELLGRPVETLHPEENMDQYVGKFSEAINQGSVQFSKFDDGRQVYLVTKADERIPVDINATVVEGQAGPVLFGIARDITALKRYEDEVTQLAGELAVVNRIVRHDIRNDMAVILAWVEQLKAELGEEHQETLDLLLRRTKAVVELTDTVKDYVEMLEGDTEIQLESVLLPEIIEQEATATRQAYDRANVEIGDIPNSPVLANRMVVSVFRNLFHNAVQHNDKDIPEIVVTGEETDETVTVHVADNGPGIPDTRKEDLFGKGDKGLESSGTGIGLYLVNELLDRFGGDVTIRDNDPDGTIFTLELQKA